MIRINLLRTLGLQVAPGLSGGDGVVSPDLQKQATIKFVVILLMPFLLYVYERFNISVLETELQKIQRKVTQIEQEKQSFGSAAPRVEQYAKEKKDIDRQLDIVRGLTRNRLREVKSLDYLQSLLPSKAWFDDVQIEGGSVKLVGYTSTEDGVSNLMRALEGSVFFSKVTPGSTVQVDLPTGPAKKFELEFKVGKQE